MAKKETVKRKKINNEIFNEKPPKLKPYFGYYTRFILSLLATSIFISLTIILLTLAIAITKEEKFHYTKESDLDYKVYLKENEFYETPYLNKNMSYIASLIDYIDLSFMYRFNIDEQANVKFTYDIIGKLVITDTNGENTYFEKDYTLLKEKEANLKNDNFKEINENITINYDEYNSLANKFKMSYGVDTVSYLTVYLNVKYEDETKVIPLNGTDQMNVKIPLSEKSINIKLDYQKINKAENVKKDFKIGIKNIAYIVLSIICLILSIFSIIKFIKLLILISKKPSNYDKYINKLLIEYDRFIVETTSYPNNVNIIKVDKFKELLDVRDNLKLPIMYFNVASHQKCHFFIKNNNDLYLTTIKAVDLTGDAK